MSHDIGQAALVAQSMGGLTCLGFTIAYERRPEGEQDTSWRWEAALPA